MFHPKENNKGKKNKQSCKEIKIEGGNSINQCELRAF